MIWRRRLIALVCLAAFGASSAAHAHGFKIFLLDNKIMAESEDFTNMNEHLYNGNFGFQMSDLTGALALIGGGINLPGDTFTMEIFSPVWFSDGNVATPIGPDLTMLIDSYADYIEPNHYNLLDSASFTAASTGSRTLPLPAHNSDTMIWSMSSGAIASGVYGMGVVIHGLDEGNPSTPFISSDRLVITFRTPGFGNGNAPMLHAARQAVFDAALADAVTPSGDFDGDGDVDGADFVAWQTNFPIGSDALPANGDADSDGDVDGADFGIWQSQFAQVPSAALPSNAAVPEPSTAVVGVTALVGLLLMKRRRTRR